MVQATQHLLGQSPAWLATLDLISGLAALDKPILVVGERGTGKTLVAGRLHFLSPRWEQNWQAVNCAALSGGGLDTCLFGGAGYTRESVLESADGGTLLLDNIDAAPLQVQEKVLNVIETGRIEAPGDAAKIDIDVRILATSAAHLPTMVTDGHFSAGLLDVLAFDVITLPPLRVRGGDILVLAEHFATTMVANLGEEGFAGFSAEVRAFLNGYDWPGNIRELKTVIGRAVGRAWNEEEGLAVPVSQIDIDAFASPWGQKDNLKKEIADGTQRVQQDRQQNTQEKSFTRRTEAFELALLHEALTQAKNHQGKAAKYLGLSYHQFRGLLRKYGLKK